MGVAETFHVMESFIYYSESMCFAQVLGPDEHFFGRFPKTQFYEDFSAQIGLT